MKFIGIIPSRYKSTRFPGKPLAMIGGMTMIERVYRQASLELDEVIVATDDTRIFDTVTAFGGRAVMTAETHPSGTDRCREAYTLSGSDAEVIINIQGDEPFIEPAQIADVKSCFDDPSTEIATLVRPFDPARGFEALSDPNTPKVVFNNRKEAIYFSRSVIPYVRNHPKEQWAAEHQYYTHIGLYAYRADILDRITRLGRGSLETAESLEQLRWLENGFRIKVAVSDYDTIGIDTPADLEAAITFLKQKENRND